MNTIARIATVCQEGRLGPTVEDNVRHVLRLLDRALESQPDLVCLPENFNTAGAGPSAERDGEPVPGPTTDRFARKAREHRCAIICPLRTRMEGLLRNSAVLFGRDGGVAGVYHKACPVTTSPDYTSLEDGALPGGELPVFDLDFGRIAIQICFDIGFPSNWMKLAENDARVVFWPSAYDGGFPLRAYAALHGYYVVTSTRTGQSRIINPLGEIVSETEDGSPVLTREINLDFVVAHWDFNMAIPDRIREAHGDRVPVRRSDPGFAHFLVEPSDPSIRTEALMAEFGFEPAKRYYLRHRAAYGFLRDGCAPPEQHAAHGDRPQWSR